MTAIETPQQDLADASPDAVALFRPVRPEALTPFLDLDEESEESKGIYAEALEDGSFLLFTFQPFEAFAEDPAVAHAWLAQFGESLGEIHGDPRGLLFFPDDLDPESTTYDGVVEEVADDALWVPLDGGIDMNALHALASQLLGGAGVPGGPGGATSFDIGRMFEGMQGHLAEALRLEQGPAEKSGEEDQDDPRPGGKPPTKIQGPPRPR